MTYFLILLIGLGFSGCHSVNVNDKPVTLKNLGILVGRTYEFNGSKVDIFRGVPYADPPLLNNRFRPPQPLQPWTGYRNATKYGNACLQFMGYVIYDLYSRDSMARQSEDCLYLNIFAPEIPKVPEKKHPVLVWIHGGSFLAGSGDTGIDDRVVTKNFVRHGIILVTINYRLGPLGFASSREGENKGNFGLYDQLESLIFLKHHIGSFGGDPDKVTIMGESAGGASVSILALSPMTEGYVNQAIVMSGSGAAIWAIGKPEDSLWDVHDIISYLSCRHTFSMLEINDTFAEDPTYPIFFKTINKDCPMIAQPIPCHEGMTTEAAWDCLRRYGDFSDFKLRKVITVHLSMSKAVVDGKLVMGTADELFERYPRIPVMTGVAELEWAHKIEDYYGVNQSTQVTSSLITERIQDIISNSYRERLNEGVANSTMDLIGNATRMHYVESKRSLATGWSVTDFVDTLRAIESDAEFVAPCETEATSYAEKGVPVWLYSFEHVPKNRVRNLECGATISLVDSDDECMNTSRFTTYTHAFHGLDHAYMFTEGYSSNQNFTYTKEDYLMADLFSSLIRNFTMFGNPTPDGSRVIWRQHKVDDPNYIRVKLPLKLERDHFRASGSFFWNKFVPKLSNYVSLVDKKYLKDMVKAQQRLTETEKVQFEAYKRAWWALWILVASIAFLLWTGVIYMVARRCLRSDHPHTYKNVLISTER